MKKLNQSQIKKVFSGLVVFVIAIGYQYFNNTSEESTRRNTDQPTEQVESTTGPSQSAVEITYNQAYSSPEDVSSYLDTYEELPPNYITKSEAEALGWDSSAGNLWDVTNNMSIGGDHFGNYEGQLPEEDNYREADVNYHGGYRSGERLIYSDDGDIYYTDDHYESFEQLFAGDS